MVWLTRSQATPQASSTSHTKPAPSPTHRPPSSPTTTAANPINSSGTMFGFDLQHTRFNPMEQTLSAANVSRLVRYWAASTSAAIASSPVVANGLVYIGSNDYNLYAFDATTSIQRWKAHTGNEIHSSPAIAHGVVYIGSNDSILYAFYASNGNPFWKVPTGGPIDSSPTIANGIVYVGSDDYNLYALDATASTQRWTPTSPTRYAINSSPANRQSPMVSFTSAVMTATSMLLMQLSVAKHAGQPLQAVQFTVHPQSLMAQCISVRMMASSMLSVPLLANHSGLH